MGGGGRGGTFYSRSPEQLIKQVRKAEDDTSVKQFEAALSNMLGNLLASCNDRDVDTVRERLDAIKDALREYIGGTIDQLFGGSVAKHTYVNGLSDIDSLVILNDSQLEGVGPSAALEQIKSILSAGLSSDATLTLGRMAVTLQYPDGMTLQVLPAIRTEEGRLKVPSSRHSGWSEIDPETFTNALTARNQQCNNKLVPTIKLAKAIIGQLPEAQRLSGYHIESLAIAAFKHYNGPKTTSAMLPTFFERARELVATPMKDSTGQSIHVDGYLGGPGSADRIAAGHILERLAKRMRNATASGSETQWRALFGLDP